MGSWPCILISLSLGALLGWIFTFKHFRLCQDAQLMLIKSAVDLARQNSSGVVRPAESLTTTSRRSRELTHWGGVQHNGGVVSQPVQCRGGASTPARFQLR